MQYLNAYIAIDRLRPLLSVKSLVRKKICVVFMYDYPEQSRSGMVLSLRAGQSTVYIACSTGKWHRLPWDSPIFKLLVGVKE